MTIEIPENIQQTQPSKDPIRLSSPNRKIPLKSVMKKLPTHMPSYSGGYLCNATEWIQHFLHNISFTE